MTTFANPSILPFTQVNGNVGKPIVSTTPTFLLRKVDPHKVFEDYKAGKFSRYVLPEKKVEVSIIATAVQSPMGTSQEDDIFAFRLRNNTVQTVATTNQNQYVLYSTNGYEMPVGGQCDWCDDEFTEQSIGIPVRSAEIIDATGKKTAYYMENCFCSYECAFAAFKRLCGVNYRSRDPIYMNSESLLRHLYNLSYPDGPVLREAPDYGLRKRRNRGGPLDREEFNSKKHTYVRMPNVILAPIKVQYYKQPY